MTAPQQTTPPQTAPPQTTLRQFFRAHYLPAHNLRPASVTQYEVQINHVDRHVGRPARLDDLSDELLYAIMQRLVAGGDGATTANKLRLHINALWRSAEELGLVDRLPRNKRYRVDLDVPVALMPEELDAILAAAGERTGFVGDVPAGQWWLTAVLFYYDLGARKSATFAVPTANLDLARGEVLLPPELQKQRRGQRLDLHAGVVRWLRELRLAERKVATVLGDWPYTIRCFTDHFAELFVEIGMFPTGEAVPRAYKLHILRKTLASQIYAAEGIEAARERLGHSSTTVTWRYIDPRYSRKMRISEIVRDPSPARLATSPLKLFRGQAG